MNKTQKRGCLGGCGLVTLVLVAIAGTGSWYAAQMTKEFKQVKASEEILVQAVAETGAYQVDLVHPPEAQRITAFLEVRAGLVDRRGQLIRSVTDFQTERDRGFSGPWGFYRSLRAGTELAPVYAGFWQKRNELLLAQDMGPDEYTFLYRLIFHTWLGHDPHDGLETPRAASLSGGQKQPDPSANLVVMEELVWQGDRNELDLALSPWRQDLDNTYSALLNPLECLFTAQEKIQD